MLCVEIDDTEMWSEKALKQNTNVEDKRRTPVGEEPDITNVITTESTIDDLLHQFDGMFTVRMFEGKIEGTVHVSLHEVRWNGTLFNGSAFYCDCKPKALYLDPIYDFDRWGQPENMWVKEIRCWNHMQSMLNILFEDSEEVDTDTFIYRTDDMKMKARSFKASQKSLPITTLKIQFVKNCEEGEDYTK